MGEIRGRHNSPGIYTSHTGIQYPNTKKKTKYYIFDFEIR
jgi:hypothetical protein